MPLAVMWRTLKGEAEIRSQGRRLGEACGGRGGERWGREAQDISYGDMGWGRRYLAWGGGGLPWDGTQEKR